MITGDYLYKILLGFCILFAMNFSAQINSSRSKGNVFKSRPDKPSENIDHSGLVVVTKSSYGLNFEDRQISADVKNRIEKFFKRRLNGYTDLKKYHLQIQKRNGKWYIGNNEI